MPRRTTAHAEQFEPDEAPESSARPFWSGTITFGLVSIPVNLYPAARGSVAALHMLSPDGEPLRRRYISAESGKEVSDEEMARGYEIEKDHYVIVRDEELERLEPEKSRDIDLRLFVRNEEIAPLYFERAYFLAPAGASVKAYQLLAETMESRGRAGIATFVMRGKEYLVAILSENGILRAETMRFSDEIRTPEEIGLPKPARAPKAAVRRFQNFIKKHSAESVSPEELRNDEEEKLLKLVQRKQEHHKDVVETEETEKKPAKVVDLMEVLKRSLAEKER